MHREHEQGHWRFCPNFGKRYSRIWLYSPGRVRDECNKWRNITLVIMVFSTKFMAIRFVQNCLAEINFISRMSPVSYRGTLQSINYCWSITSLDAYWNYREYRVFKLGERGWYLKCTCSFCRGKRPHYFFCQTVQ